jgi:hypothetical protein
MTLGVPTLAQLLDEKFYLDLDGGLLEALGLLFKRGVTLSVYPWKNPATGELVTAENFTVAEGLKHLYAHLLGNGLVRPMRHAHLVDQPILPTQVLALIQAGDPAWESAVPAPVVAEIRKKRLFGWAGDKPAA